VTEENMASERITTMATEEEAASCWLWRYDFATEGITMGDIQTTNPSAQETEADLVWMVAMNCEAVQVWHEDGAALGTS
jgi:hypothetical protein